jgi:hypothetical protein
MSPIHKRHPIRSFSAPAVTLGFLLVCLGLVLTAQLKPGLEGLEGLYRYKFQNGLMNGKKYESENRLALLKVTYASAYFSTHLEWANGHTCDLSGIADLDATGALIYRKPSIEGQTCLFSIKTTRNGLVFGDEGGACRLVSCGVRGRLAGVEFRFKDRGQLNGDEIRKSREFANAVVEHKQPPPER